MMDSPFLVFVISLVAMWLSAQAGFYIARKRRKIEDDEREDLGVVIGAALALLGLIIGFTFSMAVGRYNQRKDLEAAEANAIGTEYARAGLLPEADTAKARNLLRSYLEQRILSYTTRQPEKLAQISASTAQLQKDLWLIVQKCAAAQPTPIMELAVAGMNDVLNSQAYTEAAFLNRIPLGAWALMAAVAISCNVLIGYSAHPTRAGAGRFLLLPLILAVSFLLIADIDSPRGGLIRVHPANLELTAASLWAS